jgi:hypothetical protein
MMARKPGRDQTVDILAQQLRGRPAEQAFDLIIYINDLAIGIHSEEGVRRGCE